MGKHLIRRGKGVFKILFIIDDFFRLFTMTILFSVLFNWLNVNTYILVLAVILGVIIDVHDFLSDMKIVRLN